MSYQVGKWYRVPAVQGRMGNIGWLRWWPVTGPKHTDVEIVDFPPPHYHIDWRFVPQRFYKGLSRHRSSMRESGVYALTLHEPDPRSTAFALNPEELRKPELRRMKCLRQLPLYPHPFVPWMAKLERAYAGCKLKAGMVCPHKGIPLDTLPTENDIVTCPGHGLRWNVKTGELVASDTVARE